MAGEGEGRRGVRALSLRQPYCHAVLYGGKSIENRRWQPVDPKLLEELRHGFLIHAAKGMPRAYYAEAMAFIASAMGAEKCAEFLSDFTARAHFGGIVGRARLVEIVKPWVAEFSHGKDALGQRPMPAELLERFYPPGVNPKWHMREQWGFALADVTPLPFTPLKGRLSFFRVPEYLVPYEPGLS